jgi:hypothetical protein
MRPARREGRLIQKPTEALNHVNANKGICSNSWCEKPCVSRWLSCVNVNFLYMLSDEHMLYVSCNKSFVTKGESGGITHWHIQGRTRAGTR